MYICINNFKKMVSIYLKDQIKSGTKKTKNYFVVLFKKISIRLYNIRMACIGEIEAKSYTNYKGDNKIHTS